MRRRHLSYVPLCLAIAAPVAAQEGLIRVSDYPAEAIRNQEEGTVRVALRISPQGRVTECTIIQSASRSLDVATCRLITHRARFAPATDDSGVPREGQVETTIEWRLGEYKKDKGDARGLRLE